MGSLVGNNGWDFCEQPRLDPKSTTLTGQQLSVVYVIPTMDGTKRSVQVAAGLRLVVEAAE